MKGNCSDNRIVYRVNSENGFTLLEMAIVLVVLALLSGSFITPTAAYFESQRRASTMKLLEVTRQALTGFVAAHGRLPCPALLSGPAVEQRDCTSRPVGAVPAATLGMQGEYNEQGLLVDAWNRPLRYAVTTADHPDYGERGQADFLTAGEMSRVGMQYLTPDLSVCAENADADCRESSILANQLPAVVFSLGKDPTGRSGQSENLDGDTVFLKKEYSQLSGEEFDDIVVWLSENILFYHLLQAGVLP